MNDKMKENDENFHKSDNIEDNSVENLSENMIEGTTDTIQHITYKSENSENKESYREAKSWREAYSDFVLGIWGKIWGFVAKHDVLQRFIGIFLVFISFITVKNYNLESRIHFKDNWTDFSKSVDIKIMFIVVGGFFVLLTALKELVKPFKKINFDSYIFVFGLLFFGTTTLWRSGDINYYVAIVAVISVFINSFVKYSDFQFIKKCPGRVYGVFLAMLSVGVITYISVTTICNHRIFSTATFDMGIFIQMFHSMREDFSLVTTCERDKFLSHFAIHCSPIYYLLYPFYAVFPYAETLLIAQAVIVISGVIPLCLICKKYNFSKVSTFLFGIIYIFSSSLISPCYYDFHENAFLPPLLMWFFYAFEKNRTVMMYIFMVLVLFVKEDAALYLMCFGMYMLLSGRGRRHGFIVFTLSTGYFSIVTSLMGKYGEGVMTSRTFGNLMVDESKGFGEVIKTVLTNPAYFISEIIGNEDKFKFVITMLLPLMFVPFMTKQKSRLLIVVPFIIMNLASGYDYAYNIGFQYVFGTTACLIYVTVMNCADMNKYAFRKIVPVMAAASFLSAICHDSGKIYMVEVYNYDKDKYQMMEEYLDLIPEDASVQATTWLLPHVAQRKEVYMADGYLEENIADFVAVQTDYMDEWKIEKMMSLENDGYEVYCEEPGVMIIYVSSSYEFKK